MVKTLSMQDVARHNTPQSCWVVISRHVYDLTEFLDNHPGGTSVILRKAGKDATEEYEQLHPPGTLERHLSQGVVDESTAQIEDDGLEKEVATTSTKPIPLELWQNLDDVELASSKVLSPRAYIYFSSAADGLNSVKANSQDWKRLYFRPRVLKNVSRVDMRREFMNQKSSLPIFISPAALAKLAHQDGEVGIARAAAAMNVPYCLSTYSSCSAEEVIRSSDESNPKGSLVFQLYVPKSRKEAEERIRSARMLGFKALVVTVDTPVVGKREEDERYKAEQDYKAGVLQSHTPKQWPKDEHNVLRGVHSSTLNWDDFVWIQEAWNNQGPVILKGIQTVEDALRAYQMGFDGIYLSNHGGRQLDFAPSSIRTLLEIHKFCPQILGKMEILVDGGVRRGTDVVKALCLGATAVGVGRPTLYGLGCFGTDGVMKVLQLLSDEIETTMRLLGVTSLDQLSKDHINTKELERDLPDSIPYFAIPNSSKL